MKKINISKKILAIIFLIITIFGTAQPIFAVSGTANFVSSQWASYYPTTESKSEWGIIMRTLTNTSTKVAKTVFCSEHGKEIITGVKKQGDYYTPTNQTVKNACKVAYFGWYSKYGDYVINGGITADRKKDYAFTQQLIWETLGQSSAKFKSSTHQSQYESFKAEINEKIRNMQVRPSFSATTIELEAGETKVITDSNGVLADYGTIDRWKDNVRFQHTKGENTLTITVSEDCSMETLRLSDNMMKEWGMTKEGTEDCDTTIYFEFKDDDVQNQLYALNYNDPITMSFDLKINLLGNLELNKLNSNGDLIDGSIFNITGANGFNQDVEVKNGKITLEKIKKGIYTIKEKYSPTGYLLNKETYRAEVRPNQTTRQVIVNSEPTGEITLTKVDIDTGNANRIDGKSHHGDASIKGAEYTLYASNDIYNKKETVKYFSKDEEIAKFTFNEYGVATIKITNNTTPASISVKGNTLQGLPMGNFYAIETLIPTGYTKDTNTYTYTLSYKDSNTEVIKTSGIVKNTVQKAPFEVIKVTTNNNTIAETVEGAEFTAILSKYVDFYGSFDEAKKHLNEFAEDEYSIFKTGSNGHGTSGLLAYGEYTVNETYTPSAEIETVEQFYVTIDKDSKTPIKELVANDLPFESYLKLQKQDKNTGKFVTYSNAEFELYKLNENTKKWEQVQCKVGNNYYKTWKTNENGVANTETKLGAGKYKLLEVSIPTGFVQLDEEIIFNIDRRNPTLNYDKDLDAWITVTAKNEQPTGMLKLNKKVTLRDDVDKTMIKDIDFTKISFELVTDDRIIDYADGSTIFEKGQTIGKYNLKEDGTLTIDNINMGKYHLKELTTIDGAVLDEKEYEVIFEQTDVTTKKYVVELNIENQTTCVEISKTDITGEKELIGAKLTVIDENNEVIDSWVSSEDSHKIEGLKAGKEYTLIEEIAPDSYTKASSIKFTIQDTAEIQKVVMIDKQVIMTKEDIAGKEIEGAELQVVDKDGNIIDEWTSTKEPHIIKGLIEGESYTLYEKYAPDAFVISNKVEFTVTEDKETQEIKMIDKIVEVVKTDFVTGEEIEGAKLQVVDENNNIIDEWISTKEPHKVVGLEENKKYKLIELISPYSYQVAEEIEFTVTEEKTTQRIDMKDMPILTNIRVIKIDSETKKTIKEKFVFGIYEDSDCTKLIKEIKSNKEDGFITFEDLRYGVFYVKELKAPKNYELSDRVTKIEINDNGVFVDDTKIEKENNIYSFEFENRKIETPKTRR